MMKLNMQFDLKSLVSPKVLYPVGIALLFVMYTLGRADGASKAESTFETYRKNSEKVVKISRLQRKQIEQLEGVRLELVKQNNVLIVKDKKIDAKLAKMQKTLDSLNTIFGHQIDSLPTEVPPVCSPWATALTTCQVIKKQLEAKVDTLNEKVKNKEDQIQNKDEQITNLGTQNSLALQRGDSLQAQLELLPKPETCKIFIWFGPKCPSRTTMTVISGALGTIAGFVLHSYVTK